MRASRVLLLAVLAVVALAFVATLAQAERVSYPVVYNDEVAEPSPARIFLEQGARATHAKPAAPKKQSPKKYTQPKKTNQPQKNTNTQSKKTQPKALKSNNSSGPKVGNNGSGIPTYNPNGQDCRKKLGTPVAGSWRGSEADRASQCPKSARAISYGIAAARPASIHCCGVGVGNALLAAGIGDIRGAARACDKGAALRALGYTRLPNLNNPQPGDVWVWSCVTAHNQGHIQIKKSSGWITDFAQTNNSPWGSLGGSTATAYRLAPNRCV